MLDIALANTDPCALAIAPAFKPREFVPGAMGSGGGSGAAHQVAQTLSLLQARLSPKRRIVHAGDVIYSAGERFTNLYVLNSGMFKIVSLSADGREQVVGIKFRGDWLGLGAIAEGRYTCDALAMDTGEVWAIDYRQLLAASASASDTALLTVLHQAMSREIAHERDALMSVCTLPADARVAEFLRRWAESLARCGMRTDEIALRMTRAEIGNYLGMTLETVSRALSRLAREKLIGFAQKGRRDVQIPDLQALADFVQRCVAPQPALLH
ncbi:MAG: Crp/Fnr family transcriptional regulator [Burkholderiaceae bacterium]